MLSDKMLEALNEQINRELYSEYLYLSMAAWFEDQGLPGFAAWMRAQTQEEHFHAMKLFDYVNEVNGKVSLKTIEGPPVDFESPLAIFEASLEHEKYITASINERMKLAMDESDFATANFLQWYVAEQVEEEANVGAVVDKLRLSGGQGNAILMLDQQLGTRVFTQPTAADEA
jgi:ferritin